MIRTDKKRNRTVKFGFLALCMILVVVCAEYGDAASGNTDGHRKRLPVSGVEHINMGIGQSRDLALDQIPLTYRMTNPGFEAEDKSKLAVDARGRLTGLKPGASEVYAGTGLLHIRVAKVKVQPSKIIYLTFDDGPSRNITEQILKLLDENQIHATFFLVGQYVDYYPDLVTKIDMQGHAIGIHSDTHRYRDIYKDKEALLRDVDTLDTKLRRILHEKISLYRFPGGSFEAEKRWGKDGKREILDRLREKGYRCFDWDASIGDASTSRRTAEEMLASVKKQIGKDDRVIVLAHDMGLMENTPETIKQLIQYAKKRGYTFDTLDHYPGERIFP